MANDSWTTALLGKDIYENGVLKSPRVKGLNFVGATVAVETINGWVTVTIGAGTDGSAIHDNVAGEIAAIALKGVPSNSDFLLIEDAADSNNKKRVTIGSLPSTSSDTNAIHDNVGGEIAAISEKASPVDADLVIIEDSADSNNKKKVQIGNLPNADDPDAIHDNESGEIAAITEKVTPVSADLLIIEDSAASNAKKRVQIGNLPGDANAIHDNVAGEIVAVTEKASPVSADVLLIEDSEAANVKKRVQLGNLPGGTDANAIHDNVSGEIAAITGKATPTTSDFLLIEDAADSNAKKRVTIGDLPGTGLTGSAPANVTKAAADVGAATSAARADHKHDISTAAPAATGVATSSGEGSATTLARSDHTHQANTAPVNVTKAAAAIGTSGQPARADHKHDVTTAAAVELTDSTNAEGNATSLARSNHTHAHGNRGGGSLHAAVVSGGNAGFMIGADKLKLDKFTAEYSGTDATRMRVDGLYSQTEIADSFSVEVDTADSPAASSLLRDNAGNAVSLAEGFTYYFEVTVETNDGSVDESGKYLVVANRRSGEDVAFSGSILSSGDATTSGLDMQFDADTVNQRITCQPTVGGKAADRKVRWSVRVERRPVVTEDA